MIVNPDRRGRTAGGRATYRPLVQLEPDDFPPDSKYWHSRAMGAAEQLVAVIGYDAYCAWIDEQPEMTWRQLHDACSARLKDIQDHPAECGCVLPEQRCQACRAAAATIYPIEEQF